jgi:long-chain acyl-CoA synthetase
LADTEPDKIALQSRDKEGTYSSISFKELYRSCLELESKLESLGLRAGDHIALYGDNSINWAISYISIHFLGAVIIPLDALLGPREILNFLNFSDSKVILTDDSHIDKLRGELAASGSHITIISIESIIGENLRVRLTEPYNMKPDDLLAILFTSGTTGTPKGVQLSNKNVFSIVKAILESVDVSKRDNVLNILPLHHGYSSIVAFISPLFAGATVIFSESLKSSDLISAVQEKKVTIFPGVPRLFELLYSEIDKRVRRLPTFQKLIFRTLFKISEVSWKAINIRLGRIFFAKIHEPFGGQFRFFTSGGARLNPKILSDFFSLGFRMAEGYGLTETSAVSTLTSPDRPVPGSAGKPLPGVDIMIAKEGESNTGEICIKGPNITPGYYKNAAATNELIRNGWLYSGDLGSIDGDGNLFITGRAKEVIVLPSGKNIYPEDVESLYNDSPLIAELCVVPLKSATGSVTGLRMIVVPDMKEIKERGIYDINDRIRSTILMAGSSLPSYMQVSNVSVYHGELPKTRLGKFKRNEIEKIAEGLRTEERAEERELSPEEKELSMRPESDVFLKRFSGLTDLDGPFSPADDLTLDLGLDSLMLVQILTLLEKEFGVLVPESEIPELRTIGDILNKLPEIRPGYTEEKLVLNSSPQKSESLENVFNLKRGIIKRLSVRVLQIILWLITLIAFRPEIKDLRKIPMDKAVLLCPNHQSLIDPMLIFSIIPGRMLERLLFTGFGEYFSTPPLSWIVRPMRIIPTGTARTYAESLRLASEGLRMGMSVCIFPEGERTSTGKVMYPRTGAGLLSVETSTPIVPIHIDGALNTLSPLSPKLRFPKVSITVMDTIDPAAGDGDKKELYKSTIDSWYSAMQSFEEKTEHPRPAAETEG